MPQPRLEHQWKLWLGQVLSCDEDGCLDAMGHKAAIEQVTGHRLGSGCEFGLGINSTSPLRLNPMGPLIHNDQVFKSHLLVLPIFFFLSQTTMSTIDDQFMAEEAHMAAMEAKLAKQRVESARLWKAAEEEVKQKAEEEQR